MENTTTNPLNENILHCDFEMRLGAFQPWRGITNESTWETTGGEAVNIVWAHLVEIDKP